MVKALFFDLDGTISDTHALHLASWIEILRPHGIDVDLDLYKKRLKHQENEAVINELLPALSAEEIREMLEAEAASYRGRATKAGPILGLYELLEEGRRRGLTLGLVTNAPSELAGRSLEALGLSEAFDPMVFAEEAEAHKPDPAPYELALERLGIPPAEALAFEDSPKGITAAARAGIPAVGLHSAYDPDELRGAGAEIIAGDFADPAIYGLLDR